MLGEHFSNSLTLELIHKLQVKLLREAGGRNSLYFNKLLDSEQWKSLYLAKIFHTIQSCRTQSKQWCYAHITFTGMALKLSSRSDTYSWKIASREIGGYWSSFPFVDEYLSQTHPKDYIPNDIIDEATERAKIITNTLAAETWSFQEFSDLYWGET